ncbi:hypothetical protein ID875_19630 [Streptomyces globisporus]|uniref:Uncharacterized protein n=1 Tax=Streptomyces globisporus TaxID=1908 RepID=A0A927GP65_STRGL|nr:hypothetical protein [Streptomyces globisporus]
MAALVRQVQQHRLQEHPQPVRDAVLDQLRLMGPHPQKLLLTQPLHQLHQ